MDEEMIKSIKEIEKEIEKLYSVLKEYGYILDENGELIEIDDNSRRLK